ncbi:class II fructose-bisphosphate aldolase [Methanoregula sp.]|uniref:class II fructose-bisphosphate aldolase n=1 Tax=Methanoregula sp. TaxID=2052170 RepID=UPI002605C884|nr:class II fructose-bisphosphate aldolase [Methanoregula sp.]MDD5143681.1 class II fructose-bisphosphate aldolase [Methanoregula sp.]
MSVKSFSPMPGSAILSALAGQKTIVMAANVRVASVAKGIFRAAKDTDSAVFMELARSECDLKGGYTGMTPADFSKRMNDAAAAVGFDMWALHADHITIKKGDAAEIESTKQLIDAQIAAGYTSFAIDASHLFNFEGKNVREELDPNIRVTTELAQYISKKMNNKEFGLEVEVGEIGRKDNSGLVLTKPEEAVTFIKALNENGVNPHVLAIANGSTHGHTYDAAGNVVEQLSIDIPQTKEIAQALRDNKLNVGIAQHGITGTPRDLINLHFPKGDIIKGNVGTFWQDVVFSTLKVYEPALYKSIQDWTLEKYRPLNQGKSDCQIFDGNCKMAIKEFFKDLYSLDEKTEHAIQSMAYAESLVFFRAFGAYGSASVVRKARK